ncbi:MAG: glycosyltransferase [Bacteroidota bacterium]|nr:glycosyltransferase [Bacteroidota bacterium]MDW8137605.1 glycosyltransferase [Bacteroidota bacterium]MDW8285441.1 glycosyltransferase [Bacteroidota bacterium]
MSPRPDISVIIVTYNVRRFLEQALHSLERAAEGLAVEVFVVDNSSVDGTARMVRERFPGVQLLENAENVGFARANNQAIRLARGRYVLLLNPDTLLQEDTLRQMLAFMEAHPEAGAAGCKILTPEGRLAPESRRAFPTPATAFYRMVGLSRLFPRSRRFGRYNLSYLPEDEVAEIDALSGSFMFVRREAIEQVGLLDESFFMYGEDLDWCYRIQQAGWKIYYVPWTQIVHYKGESTKKSDLAYVKLFYGAMLAFAHKHFAGQYNPLFERLIQMGIYAHAGLSLLGRALKRLRPVLFDALALALSVLLAELLWLEARGKRRPDFFFSLILPGYTALCLAGLALAGAYGRNRDRWRALPAGIGLGLMAVATISFFAKSIAFSRGVVALTWILGTALSAGWRIIWYLVHEGRLRPGPAHRRALIVGTGPEARRVGGELERQAHLPYVPIGYVHHGPDPPPEDLPVHGHTRQLRELVRLLDVDDLLFTTDQLTHADILHLLRQVQDLPVQARIIPRDRDFIIGKARVDLLGELPSIEIQLNLSRPYQRWAKRLFDLAWALGWIGLAPLLYAWARADRRAILRRLWQAWPLVWRGKRTWIGYAEPASPDLPAISPGVFTVLEAMGWIPQPIGAQQAHRYNLQYARLYTVLLDLELLLKLLVGPQTRYRQPEPAALAELREVC